jgi:hypothetical protein
MAAPLANFLARPGVLATDAFRHRWNFGHITHPTPGTSDHLPVLMVI